MTMQINKEQTVAGYPAYAIRHLMRYVRLYDAISGEFAARILNIEKDESARLISRLSKLGFLTVTANVSGPLKEEKGTKPVWYEITELGISLALASAAPRIKRRTADKIVEQFLIRVHQANKNGRYLYEITAVVAFGSYVSDREDLGDIDLALQLTPREGDDNRFFKLCRAKIAEAYDQGRRFRNLTDEVCWPRNEIRRFLRARKRSLSLPDLQELQSLAEETPLKYRVLLGDRSAIQKLLGPNAVEV
jgi:hypothetical protein